MNAPFDHVQARGLVKMYGATRALGGVDVRLDAGRITSIEGENGSGKSTLLLLLAGLSKPTRGDVHYGSIRLTNAGNAVRAHVGVVSHAPLVYPDLTGRENLTLFAQLHGLRHPAVRVGALVERFALDTFVDRPTRTYSRGQLQRTSLARALIHEPRFLLLDEPTTGLDTAGQALLAEVLRAEREAGRIVAMVTHDSAFTEDLADMRIRLVRGRLADVVREQAHP